MKYKVVLLLALAVLVFVMASCDNGGIAHRGTEEPTEVSYTLAGLWVVKEISVSGELVSICSQPGDAVYPEISISIPEAAKENARGNTFCESFGFDFEIREHQQISIESIYVENELMVQLKEGIDAAEFTANSPHGIFPKRQLSESLNIWLFGTDGTEQLSEIVDNLSQNPDVIQVQYNHACIALRNSYDDSFCESFCANLRFAVKFDFSENGELMFFDSSDNLIITFIRKELI